MITQAMLNDIEDIELAGIDTSDYPDFVYEAVMKHLY